MGVVACQHGFEKRSGSPASWGGADHWTALALQTQAAVATQIKMQGTLLWAD